MTPAEADDLCSEIARLKQRVTDLEARPVSYPSYTPPFVLGPSRDRADEITVNLPNTVIQRVAPLFDNGTIMS